MLPPVTARFAGIEPFRVHSLPVGSGHTLYVEECGQAEGLPVIFLHGGPGGGARESDRGFFDPQRYRAVLFDQRGCGRSTPHASLEANTTWDLVADIERIREHLGIERWVVFGGSWGSTLALAYATKHPERVLELILRGIFLLRPEEIRWFYAPGGTSWIYPDAFEAFLAPLSPKDRADPVPAYYRLLCSEDPAVRLNAARAWSVWEATCIRLLPDTAMQQSFAEDTFAEAFARIECHYFMNHGFFGEGDSLLERARRLRGVPGTLIHGRYDVVTPLENAWLLHKAWPESELHIIDGAGHSSAEPGLEAALMHATQRALARYPQN